MAGIYIHIPFCKQACHYCDFHFSTSLKSKGELVRSIRKEITIQKNYLTSQEINTIYFGGGTPSVLEKTELEGIFKEIDRHFPVAKDAEITLEANPDDLSREKLKELTQTPVNRLSIGIQSFRDEDLTFLNRVHSSKEAIDAVRNAKDLGFENITVDLIYGIQTLSNEGWKRNIEQVLELNVPHISCYSLTVEPRTALADLVKKGKVTPPDSGKSAGQFEILINELKKAGYVHYEISNFSKPERYSRHNSNYWKGEHYLGIGPSAHSFNGTSRQWNVKSNAAYITSIEKGEIPFESETLTETQRYNEYVLTSLRTIWGIDVVKMKEMFRPELILHFLRELEPFLRDQKVIRKEETLILTDSGKLFADQIASDLFWVSSCK